MKIGVISESVPPVQSGQSVVLYQLLKNLDPLDYCLITQKNIFSDRFQANCSDKLSGSCYQLSPDFNIIQLLVRNAISVKLTILVDTYLKIRAQQITKILIKEKCDTAIVCTGNLLDPPAVSLACKSLGIPLIFYVFDDYIYQWSNHLMRAYAQKYEEDIIKSAVDIIVPNECLCNEYRVRYGIRPTVIHNPVDLQQYEMMSQRHLKNFTDVKRIIYTGAIYDVHYGAFRNLVKALIQIDQPDLQLHLFTNQFPEKLKKNGIAGPVAIHKKLPHICMPAVQRSANILFLPLGFEKNVHQIVKTSAPGKTGEYLTARKPILVHAPLNSFISWYFKKHDCGLVVDQDDPEILADKLLQILNDSNLQNRLTENAYLRAQTDFNIRVAQNKFYHCIGK